MDRAMQINITEIIVGGIQTAIEDHPIRIDIIGVIHISIENDICIMISIDIIMEINRMRNDLLRAR